MAQLTPQQAKMLGLNYEEVIANATSASKYGVPGNIAALQYLRVIGLLMTTAHRYNPVQDLKKICRGSRLDTFQQLGVLAIFLHYGYESKELRVVTKTFTDPRAKRSLEEIAVVVCRRGVREKGGVDKEDYLHVMEEFQIIFTTMGRGKAQSMTEGAIRRRLARFYTDDQVFLDIGSREQRLEMAVQRIVSPKRSMVKNKISMQRIRKVEPKAERNLWISISTFMLIMVLFFTPQTEDFVSGIPILGDLREQIGELTSFVTPSSFRLIPEWTEFEVRNSYEILSRADGTTFSLAIYKPTTKPNEQELLDFEVETDTTGLYSPGDPIVDQVGVLKWENMTVNMGSRATITTKATVRSTALQFPLEDLEAASGTVADIAGIPDGLTLLQNTVDTPTNGDEWLNNTRYVITPTSEAISEKAAEVTEGQETVYGQARAIYDWMNAEFEYKIGRGIAQYPEETLLQRSGDCDDQSVLFISMMRSLGVPAWLELGALYDPSTGTWVGHGWAWFFLPFDEPVNGLDYTLLPVDIVNYEFGIKDSFRFTEYTDLAGDGAMLDRYYHPLAFTTPAPQITASYSTVSFDKGPDLLIPFDSPAGQEGIYNF